MHRYAFVLVFLLMAGCAHDVQHRTVDEVCEREPSAGDDQVCPKSTTWTTAPKAGIPGANVDLHVVELTEQGQFWRLDYLQSVIDRIHKRGDNQDIILFIHGWHHDAKASDKVLQDFHRRLVDLGQRNPTRKTTGIYVGWRGETWLTPVVNSLTFWARKNVSIEVGRGAFSELFQALRSEIQCTHSRLIAIGHSFGASVLFSATKNDVMRDLMHEAREGEVKPDGIDQMIILVNPAIEATPFLPLRELTENLPRYLRQDDKRTELSSGKSPKQAAHDLYEQPRRPILAVFSSQGDWATKYVFPFGRFFSTSLFESHQSLSRRNRWGEEEQHSEWNLDRDALGNHKFFVTHQLVTGPQGYSAMCDARPRTSSSLFPDGPPEEGWRVTFPVSQTILEHTKRSSAFSPVWVTTVDTKLIEDHSAIWDPRFSCFLQELVLLDSQVRPEQTCGDAKRQLRPQPR